MDLNIERPQKFAFRNRGGPRAFSGAGAMLFQSPLAYGRLMINQLLTTYLFKDMDYAALEEMARFSSHVHLNDGDVLIHENETENFDVFVLCAGSVEIISSSSSSVSGDVAISKQDVEVFGEISWLTRRKRTATVRCRGEVEAIRIDGNAFMHYLEQHPKAGFEIMRKISLLLAQRLESTNMLLKQILWNSTF